MTMLLTLKCPVCGECVCAHLAGLWPIAPGDQSPIHQPQTHTKTDPLMSVFLENIETAYHWSARADVRPMTLTQTQQKQHKPRYNLTYVKFAQNILLGFFKIRSGTYMCINAYSMCMYKISSLSYSDPSKTVLTGTKYSLLIITNESVTLYCIFPTVSPLSVPDTKAFSSLCFMYVHPHSQALTPFEARKPNKCQVINAICVCSANSLEPR